jgi:hypothetical protein
MILKQIKNEIRFDPENKIEQLEAVKKNSSSIQYIHDPDKEVQLKAIKQNVYSIQFIRNPDKEIQLEAIKRSNFDIEVIALCPDWKEFEKYIEDNMIVKDIIE